MEKNECQQFWDYFYKSSYYENIFQISSTSNNFITAQQQKLIIYDKEKLGSLSMTAPKNITSPSTSKENLQHSIPLGKHKSTLMPDKFLNANLFSNKCNQTQYPSNDSDNESNNDYSKAHLITERPGKYTLHVNL